MLIETLEDRRMMSVSPCGISVNLTQSGSTLTLTATQNQNVIGSATLNTTTLAYDYSFNLGTTPLSGTGKL